MKKTIAALLLFCLFSLSGAATAADRSCEGQTLSIFIAATGIDGIMSEFTKDTGIKVNYMSMSSGEVLTRLRASGGKALADAWFSGGVDSYIKAGEEGFLELYRSPEAEVIDAKYKDSAGYWTGMSFCGVDFLVNTEVLKEKGIEAPKSWTDLTKPVYKGEILMANPNVSGTAYSIIFHILDLMGEEEGWAYLKALDENIPYYTKRGSGPPNKVSMGEAAVGLDPYDCGVKIIEKGFPVVSVFPEEGAPAFLSPVAMFKGAQNPEAARIFVDWCLSKRGQEVQMQNTAKVGTRPDVVVPAYLQGLKEANLKLMNVGEAGKRRKAIVERWTAEFGNKGEN